MYEVKFYEEDHLYTINDIVVPSVSQIAAEIAEVDYSSIPKFILEEAARFGTSVHAGVESFINQEPWLPVDPRESRCVFDYIHLMKRCGWNVEKMEEIVHYRDVFAGRYDQIINTSEGFYLLDIKTNYKLDMDYLSWQLSLYELAIDKELKGLKCAWLPKQGGAEIIDVPRIERDKLLEVIEYVKEKNKSPITF